ncbi:MAG: hypothetical protein ACI8TP_004289 [Acidimicrobiales bacterium]|jgi:hypothetical protein
MQDGTTDTMRVRFPAAAAYARIGRVAVAGLALRLEIDVQRVENLRLAVDAAVSALTGRGEIVVFVQWSPGELTLDIGNDDAHLSADATAQLSELLSPLVDGYDVTDVGVTLGLTSA